MITPPFLLRSISPRPPAWRRWVLSALYNFDRYTIEDWASLMTDHLRRPGGATPMQTACYTVDALRHVNARRSTVKFLSTYGDPAARSALTDAALDLKNALDKLYDARDGLLKAIGAECVTDTD
jgi:hypothetical protein